MSTLPQMLPAVKRNYMPDVDLEMVTLPGGSVVVHGCGAIIGSGPVCETEREAIEGWNAVQKAVKVWLGEK